MPKDKKQIGELLIEKGLLTEEELQKAISAQKKEELLGQTLVRLNIVSETDMVGTLSEHLKISSIELNYFSLDKKVMQVIPEDLIQEYQVVPLKIEGTILTLATADPLNIIVLDHISQISGYIVQPVIASLSEIKKTINQYYGLKEEETDKVLIESEGFENLTTKTPIIKLVDAIIGNAVRERASDIHLEPTSKKKFRVRYRIDGILREVLILPEKATSEVASRVKLMAGMDISKTRIFQDGRFARGQDIDIRASSMPTVFGEKLVLRILNKKTAIRGLNQLGLSSTNLIAFNSLEPLPKLKIA